MGAKTPWRDDTATTLCPVCQRLFAPWGRARYCSDGCRKRAWRLRHQPPPVPPPIVPAPGRSRRPITVYECSSCGIRALGQQRCDECGSFMGRVGIGGLCPECEAPVAVNDLLDPELTAAAPAPTARHRTTPTFRPDPTGRPAATRRRS